MNSIKTKYFKPLFYFLTTLFFCFNIQTSFAKEYYYQDFEVNIKINQDSTFDVTEKQAYYLDGNFGFFNRDVATKGTDAITDIEVFDGNNNKIPKSELDINSISGAKHIQWIFPRRDFLKEEKSWIVKYKVHGGISFLKNYDEIYWNAIPQKRDVAIKNVKITVSFSNNEKFRSDLIRLYAEDIANPAAGSQLDCEPECTNNYKETLQDSLLLVQQGLEYNSEPAEDINNLSSIGGYYFNQDNTEAVFWGRNLKPNTNFTIAAGFSKGIVSQNAYWKDFLFMYYGYILSIIIFLFCVIIGYVYWYKTEKSREGKRVIIPQYEPPQNLKPAMAEVIIKEKLTDKGLAATIIDLAVRGYVKIEEEPKSKSEKHFLFFVLFLAIIALIFLLAPFFITTFTGVITISRLVIFFSFIIGTFSCLFVVVYEFRNDYKVIKTKPYEDDLSLEDYEKEYLKALFGSKEYFSTKETKKSPTKFRVLEKKINKIRYKIYKETELDTKAFEIGLTKEKTKNIIWGVLGAGIFLVFFWFSEFITDIGQFIILILISIISIIGLYAFIKYEARLSDEGIKLKEDWLGFKMYLETAEKYRMQNLKPEYFEKYLPYAMIFGIEKKWAKAFEAMNIPQPSWYGGNAVVAGHIGAASMTSSFSPSAFSASFASSFSSAFSSSGASGASGGGGGAGGGGGGGGGGAG